MTAGPPVAQHSDVIHDIGYRSYEGERLGRTYAARSLLVDSLRGAYGLGRSAKTKVMPMLLLGVMVIPALVVVIVVMATQADELPLDYTNYVVFLIAAVSIFVSATAPQLVSKDLRFGVLPLYLARPITRGDYVRAKFLAMTGAVFILLAAPLLVLYAGALLAKLDFTDQTLGLLGGLVGALLFAVLFAGLSLVIASVTPRRGIGIAAIISVLMLSYGFASTLQGIAEDSGEAAGHTAAQWFGLLSPVTLADGVQSWLTGNDVAGIAGPPGTVGGLVFTAVLLGSVALSYWLLVLRYRKV